MQIKNIKKSLVRFLPIYGCIATGLIYAGIGIIALLSFLDIKEGGADEGSMLVYLNDSVIGKIVVWVILLGTVCYIIWRIYEAIKDPYEYGKHAKGLGIRTGIALSSIADAFIAFTAIQILLGNSQIQADGQPEGKRQIVQNILEDPWGVGLIIGMGVVISITALVQFFYGITQGYRERLHIAKFNAVLKKLILFLGLTGYVARGIILGIIGFFFLKSGIADDAQYIVNTDKAFDFIGDHVGHLYFIIVAIGTLFYGIFMMALGATYNMAKDSTKTVEAKG